MIRVIREGKRIKVCFGGEKDFPLYKTTNSI